MDRWYVCIDHLSDDEFEFYRWYKIRRSEQVLNLQRPTARNKESSAKTAGRNFSLSNTDVACIRTWRKGLLFTSGQLHQSPAVTIGHSWHRPL